jgi:hypothetical protein
MVFNGDVTLQKADDGVTRIPFCPEEGLAMRGELAAL